MQKTPLKRGKPLSRGTSKLFGGGKLRARKKTPEQVQADVDRREKDRQFYEEIWAERLHSCIECDRYLGEELSTAYMDHLIEKSSHNELRYEKDNIAIVCIDHHAQKTAGYPGKKHMELILAARKRYGI
jgi:5-methylcytosine-specific restriction endonuclease McrA